MNTGVPASDVMSIGFIPSSLKCRANPKSANLICAHIHTQTGESTLLQYTQYSNIYIYIYIIIQYKRHA